MDECSFKVHPRVVVDFICRYDPPQDPAVFVHRVGRTARMGRKGRAVIFLTRDEDAYAPFLEVKNVRIGEEIFDWKESAQKEGRWVCPTSKDMKSSGAMMDARWKTYFSGLTEDTWRSWFAEENVFDCVRFARYLLPRDRVCIDLSTEAFVSFFRAYQKHQCHLIFQPRKLPLPQLAQSLGLLRIPHVKEVSRKRIESHGVFEEWTKEQVDSIQYKDHEREVARVIRVKKNVEKRAKEIQEREERKDASKLSKKKKDAPMTRLDRKKRQRQLAKEDIDEINREARLLRKLKRGEITEEEVCSSATHFDCSFFTLFILFPPISHPRPNQPSRHRSSDSFRVGIQCCDCLVVVCLVLQTCG
jgi:ATP-dependent RNA helicase DDX55/SPB4